MKIAWIIRHMESMYLHHEQSPPLCHHTTWCSVWFQTREGYRDRNFGSKVGAVVCRDMPWDTFSHVFRHEECLRLTRIGTLHVDTKGLRPPDKTKKTTTLVLGRTSGGTEGGEVLRPTVQDRERSDPGGPDLELGRPISALVFSCLRHRPTPLN